MRLLRRRVDRWTKSGPFQDGWAGLLEFDGEAAHFCLVRESGTGVEVHERIHLRTGRPDFSPAEVGIAWHGSSVGLGVRGRVIAVFDLEEDNASPLAHLPSPVLKAVAPGPS